MVDISVLTYITVDYAINMTYSFGTCQVVLPNETLHNKLIVFLRSKLPCSFLWRYIYIIKMKTDLWCLQRFC